MMLARFVLGSRLVVEARRLLKHGAWEPFQHAGTLCKEAKATGLLGREDGNPTLGLRSAMNLGSRARGMGAVTVTAVVSRFTDASQGCCPAHGIFCTCRQYRMDAFWEVFMSLVLRAGLPGGDVDTQRSCRSLSRVDERSY